MVRGVNLRSRVFAAGMLGGLLASVALGQSDAPSSRSIYQRRAGEVSRTRPSDERALRGGSPSSVEPRRLPPATGQQAARQMPRASGPRGSGPRGYSSKGLFPAERSLADAARRRVSRPNQTAQSNQKLPANFAPSQGVVPAFFPAPLAAVEANAAAEPAPVAPAVPLDGKTIAAQLTATQPGEHPLLPAIRWAKVTLKKLDAIKDYSCIMVKRERIDGALADQEYMSVKIRHEPFSVYLGFVKPAKVKGQEAIYVRGRNNGEMQAHGNGMRKLFGTVSLKPDSYLAMAGNRYPITEMGLRRLVERLIEVGENDSKFGECEVKASPKKINGREVVCLQVTHPVPRKEFLFHIAKIYIDTQNGLPMRYESYDWPAETGGTPPLMEEYTYLNLKLNNGFTDKDFDTSNPSYQFK
ncbi:MAG TPA: DUF1571 domain-containing protein [Pirellulales bacterium]|nr:DUF1571 domain-containing protein [Pirellulales bacterium]